MTGYRQTDPGERLLTLLRADRARQGSAGETYVPEGADDAQTRKLLIRSLMNVRMPGSLSGELLQAQDAYLREQLAEKGTVSLKEIPTIGQQSGSGHPCADRLSLWQGDITRLGVGAIVNAANSQLLGCFVPCHKCIDNAIHSAAGLQLREACSDIMRQRRMRYGRQYEEPAGTATLTEAYNLPCDYVIHTVGPIVYGGLTEGLRQDLRNCYENVLRCCAAHRIASVAFCCISTGEFHFPQEEAARIATETVTGFLQGPEGAGIERVVFNVFTRRDLEIYEKILMAL